jgi:hypothetical protein
VCSGPVALIWVHVVCVCFVCNSISGLGRGLTLLRYAIKQFRNDARSRFVLEVHEPSLLDPFVLLDKHANVKILT